MPFGVTLTSQAKFPLVKAKDPFKKGMSVWAKLLITLCVILLLCCGIGCYMYFTRTGFFAPKAETEVVVEAPAQETEAAVDTEEAPAESAE